MLLGRLRVTLREQQEPQHDPALETDDQAVRGRVDQLQRAVVETVPVPVHQSIKALVAASAVER